MIIGPRLDKACLGGFYFITEPYIGCNPHDNVCYKKQGYLYIL